MKIIIIKNIKGEEIFNGLVENLSGADLSEANLSTAYLRHININRTKFSEEIFSVS